MGNGFLALDKRDGLIHEYRCFYSDCYEDMGPYRPNGNRLALNIVTGGVDEVQSGWGGRTWEKLRVFSPDGKRLGVRKDTGIIEEVEVDFLGRVVKRADFVVD